MFNFITLPANTTTAEAIGDLAQPWFNMFWPIVKYGLTISIGFLLVWTIYNWVMNWFEDREDRADLDYEISKIATAQKFKTGFQRGRKFTQQETNYLWNKFGDDIMRRRGF